MNNVMQDAVAEEERFEQAISFILHHEGSYVNDFNDKGGETKYGISKRSYQDVNIAALTKEQAIAIYRRDFWDKYHYNNIVDIKLATKVFDLAVNLGPYWAHRLLQRALRTTGQYVLEDGILGPVTLASVNNSDSTDLLAALKSEAAGYYRSLVLAKQDQDKFLKGWLNRAYA